MPDESTIVLSIDPRTGTTALTEGADVCVIDELGEAHEGLIIAVGLGAEPRFTVMFTCQGREHIEVVPEASILARTTNEWDL